MDGNDGEKRDRYVAYYGARSLYIRALRCLKELVDRHGTLAKEWNVIDVYYFDLKKDGFVPDLVFEDNMNPISSDLHWLLLSYRRNHIIKDIDTVEFTGKGLRILDKYKTAPAFNPGDRVIYDGWHRDLNGRHGTVVTTRNELFVTVEIDGGSTVVSPARFLSIAGRPGPPVLDRRGVERLHDAVRRQLPLDGIPGR